VGFSTLPGSTAFDRGVVLKEGRASFAWFPAVSVMYGLIGTGDFIEWGTPQSFRVVFVAHQNPMGVAVRASSDIHEMSDLKGKKVASYPTYPTMQLYIDGAMAYGNLTWDDVVETPVGSFGAGMGAVLDGTVDAAIYGGTTSNAQELAASQHGLRWMPFPNETPEQKAAWERYHEVNPVFYPLPSTTVPTASEANPIVMMGYDFQFAAYDWLDANLAYWFTKEVAENYELFRDKHAQLNHLTLDAALDTSRWIAPYHEGSIQYFKDIGRWTAEMQTKQDELLAKYPATNTR